MMFNAGLAPSEIDRRLKLLKGTSRIVIVTAWAYDKENARYDRASSGWLA